MKISCLQENLAKGLATVGRAVATRTTLPVLSNILLESDEGRLRLAATNLEIGVNCWIGARVEEEGRITVPARLLTEFVNSLPPGQIDMELNERTQTLNLKCARYEANIKGIDASEFPDVPTAESIGEQQRPAPGSRDLPADDRAGGLCRRHRREPPHPDRRPGQVSPGWADAGRCRRLPAGRHLGRRGRRPGRDGPASSSLPAPWPN